MGIVHKTRWLELPEVNTRVEYALITYDTMYESKPAHALQFFSANSKEYFQIMDNDVLKLRDFLNALDLKEK